MQHYIDVKGMTRIASSMLGISVEGNLFDWAKLLIVACQSFTFSNQKHLWYFFMFSSVFGIKRNIFKNVLERSVIRQHQHYAVLNVKFSSKLNLC
jgi:hypothetical protein